MWLLSLDQRSSQQLLNRSRDGSQINTVIPELENARDRIEVTELVSRSCSYDCSLRTNVGVNKRVVLGLPPPSIQPLIKVLKMIADGSRLPEHMVVSEPEALPQLRTVSDGLVGVVPPTRFGNVPSCIEEILDASEHHVKIWSIVPGHSRYLSTRPHARINLPSRHQSDSTLKHDLALVDTKHHEIHR